MIKRCLLVAKLHDGPLLRKSSFGCPCRLLVSDARSFRLLAHRHYFPEMSRDTACFHLKVASIAVQPSQSFTACFCGLQNVDKGTFVVRNSSNSGSIVISLSQVRI
jgi:hypothetical protein